MDSLPLSVNPPVYPRRRQQQVATAILGGAFVLVLINLLSQYLSARAGIVSSGTWDLYIPLTQPNVMLGTLILASFAAQWAAHSVAHDQRYFAYWALGILVVLGLAFLNQSWFLLSIIPLENGADPIAANFYAVVGVQIAMVVAALIYTLVMGLRTLAGNYNSNYPEGLEAMALFWHITTGAYALVWYAVYITK
jgi:heme/copper-type cytochrome/quinol oxidase subunit 3